MSSIQRSTQIRSVLFGASLAVLLLVTLGAFRPASPGVRVQFVQSDPPASSIVRIVEGQPYTVPAGRLLSIKAFGATGNGLSTARLSINGIAIADVRALEDSPALPLPIVAQPGEVITVTEAFGDDPITTIYLLGYLSDV